MKKYVIVSDTCCDLESEMRERYDIEYIPMHFTIDGKEYVADLDWKEFSVKEFYDIMRGGKRITTSQVNSAEYEKAFEQYIKEGYDILSISCSSALSASVKASCVVRDAMLAKYPQSKIVCIDSLASCYGLGLLCIRAAQMRADGKSIEEVAAWIESNKLRFNQEVTVEKLSYLKQAGRVTAASAFFGGMLNVKPIIISDAKGQNSAVMKVSGRKNSYAKIAERIAAEIDLNEWNMIAVCHADCEKDAQELRTAIEEVIGKDKVQFHMSYIGPIVGASAGPGTLGAFCLGKEVTYIG